MSKIKEYSFVNGQVRPYDGIKNEQVDAAIQAATKKIINKGEVVTTEKVLSTIESASRTTIRVLYTNKNNKNDSKMLPMEFSSYEEAQKYLLAHKELFDSYDVSMGPAFTVDLGLLESHEKTLSKIIQPDLFDIPIFKPQKTVELTKEFSLNFGNVKQIKKDFKGLLPIKLADGRSLEQHLNDVSSWYNGLKGEDLGNWIKLFAYTKAVKEHAERGSGSDFKETSPGKYSFRVEANKAFFVFFIRPDKKSGKYASKTKTKFLKWLSDNQKSIDFPMIVSGEVWNVPVHIFEIAEKITRDERKEFLFSVDTNILESEFKDYMSIKISEVDAINELWDTLNIGDFKKMRLSGFVDLPLKLLLALKHIFPPEAAAVKKGDMILYPQTLNAERLDIHLGGLTERVRLHLAKANAGTREEKILLTKRLLLESVFDVAVKRKWLFSKPKIENGIYHFNMNPGYFASKQTAEHMKLIDAKKAR